MKELNYRKGSNLEWVYGVLKNLVKFPFNGAGPGWFVCGEDLDRVRAMGMPSFRTNVSIVSKAMGIKVWVRVFEDEILLMRVK